MTHAALIIAHKNKEQLIRLIKAVSSDSVHVFIHLDKSWKLSKSEIEEIENSAKNVFVIKKRIHGKLDHYSLIQIALNLISFALGNETKTGEKYSYFMLLSGQDYPIKSKCYIAEFLEREYPKPIIDIEKNGVDEMLDRKFGFAYYTNKLDNIQLNHKKGLTRKFIVLKTVIAEKFAAKFLGTPLYRLKKLGLKLGFGSAWWILPHNVIDFIKGYIKENKKAIRIYKKTATPEETFFQTMVSISPQYKDVFDPEGFYEKNEQHSLTYANFRAPGKENVGHPHVITVEDYDRIMAKKALFARKFDMTVDGKVLDMIDREIADE